MSIRQLPNIGPSDSKREFRELLRSLNSRADSEMIRSEVEFNAELDSGFLGLRLRRRLPNSRRIVLPPSVAHFSQSNSKIEKALRKKRRQVRNSPNPSFLAISHPWPGEAIEDFDTALFGQTVVNIDISEKATEVFKSNGLFATRNGPSPIFDGILLFSGVGFKSVSGPVLYRHFRSTADLPGEFVRIDRRWYVDSQDEKKIFVVQGSMPGLLAKLSFVQE